MGCDYDLSNCPALMCCVLPTAPLHIVFSETETFWATFLCSLIKRGLRGTKLVIPLR